MQVKRALECNAWLKRKTFGKRTEFHTAKGALSRVGQKMISERGVPSLSNTWRLTAATWALHHSHEGKWRISARV